MEIIIDAARVARFVIPRNWKIRAHQSSSRLFIRDYYTMAHSPPPFCFYLLGYLQGRLADGVRAHRRTGHQDSPFEQTCANKMRMRQMINNLAIRHGPAALKSRRDSSKNKGA